MPRWPPVVYLENRPKFLIPGPRSSVAPVRSPSDPARLKGKTIGTPGKFGSSWAALLALLRAGGLTADDVTIREYPQFNQADGLAHGDVDLITGFRNNEPLRLESQGIAVDQLTIEQIAPQRSPYCAPPPSCGRATAASARGRSTWAAGAVPTTRCGRWGSSTARSRSTRWSLGRGSGASAFVARSTSHDRKERCVLARFARGASETAQVAGALLACC
jgi:hypothetical protein